MDHVGGGDGRGQKQGECPLLGVETLCRPRVAGEPSQQFEVTKQVSHIGMAGAL